jgi:hypothetical protein
MPIQSTLAATLLSIAMIGVVALIVGAVAMFRRGERQRAVLMLAAAFVTLVNVLIWTV